MTNTVIVVIIIIVSAATIYLLIQLARQIRELKDAQTNDKSILMLNQNLETIRSSLSQSSETMTAKLTTAFEAMNRNFGTFAGAMGEVKKELGTVQERFKGFEEFNELLHPKMRGNIGEQILADMLGQVFSSEHYALQHKFKGGETVDAIIRTQAGIIPIDSKFPLENFKQLTRATTDEERRVATREFASAVKKHINDISKKYLLPEEGTVNFAIMYVPSENVYYHILTDEDSNLMDYAKTKSILMTSPHGFFNFLRVIMMGLERSRLQEQAQKIWEILKGVQQEAGRFNDTLGVLARHLTNAKGSMDTVQSHFAKLTGKLDQVQLLGNVPAKDLPPAIDPG